MKIHIYIETGISDNRKKDGQYTKCLMLRQKYTLI